MGENSLRIVMFPWFAMGHITPFLDLSNSLAQNGHQIFFILPRNTQFKVEQFNLHPQLIKFVPLTVPHVEGLPPHAETTSDVVDFKQIPLIAKAMDLTRPMIESLIHEIEPHFVFLDTIQHWLPSLLRPLGIKSIAFLTTNPTTTSYFSREGKWTISDLIKPPSGFPSSSISLQAHEARVVVYITNMEEIKSDMPLLRRSTIVNAESDAICFRACREMEGPYCDFLETKLKKPIILAGPTISNPPSSTSLEEKWAIWLNRFTTRKVIYCALGSECKLTKEKFQELLLGIEFTGLPFLAALKPPVGANEVEEALPEGFKERTRERGIVHGGWVQQQHILAHSSVGCFITHCGSGSLSEALVSECQMVLLPQIAEQSINARLMGAYLRVGIEIEKGDEDGMFTKENVSKAIRLAMDEESEIGKEVRANHAKWREFLLTPDLKSTYVNEFIHKLRGLP